MCGFTGPPNDTGVVEIAYSIAPAYQGKGYATEAARALIEIARAEPAVRLICAHTLAERNASSRVLEKCGLRKVGEAMEDDLPIWRWECSGTAPPTFGEGARNAAREASGAELNEIREARARSQKPEVRLQRDFR